MLDLGGEYVEDGDDESGSESASGRFRGRMGDSASKESCRDAELGDDTTVGMVVDTSLILSGESSKLSSKEVSSIFAE